MYIILFLLISYTVFLLILIFNVLFEKKSIPQNNSNLPVSIVIPFRNEQANLYGLLQSLKNQNYKGLKEILLINDGSTDSSVQEIEKFGQDSASRITVFDSIYDPEINLTSKQQALDLGIRLAQYDWIALTDADMILKPDWLNSLMEKADSEVALAFGHTSITGKNTFFNILQKFQLEFLFAVAYVFFKTGITGSCMGNNLLISKKAYFKAGGHQTVGYNIVEDRGLLNLFYKSKMTISCTDPFHTSALTYPCHNWKQFFNQFKRWARGGINLRSSLLTIGILFSIQNLFLLLACTTILPELISIIVAVNLLLTWLFTKMAFIKIKSPQKTIFFPIFYLFLLFESFLYVFSILARNDIEWKERKI